MNTLKGLATFPQFCASLHKTQFPEGVMQEMNLKYIWQDYFLLFIVKVFSQVEHRSSSKQFFLKTHR